MSCWVQSRHDSLPRYVSGFVCWCHYHRSPTGELKYTDLSTTSISSSAIQTRGGRLTLSFLDLFLIMCFVLHYVSAMVSMMSAHLRNQLARRTFWKSYHLSLSTLSFLHPPKRCWIADAKIHHLALSAKVNHLVRFKGTRDSPRSTHITRSMASLFRWTDEEWVRCIRDTSAALTE